MVSSPDDANIPDLGFVLPNLGELSVSDADDSLGLGSTSPTSFPKVGISGKLPS
jgi:hypothetical protein